MEICNSVEDIEDMLAPTDRIEQNMLGVVPKSISKKNMQDVDQDKADALIPGTQTLWLKTFGCSHNVSDSEYMQGLLSAYGYTFTESKHAADLWVLNSCTVKDPSQAAFMNLVKEAQTHEKGLVVAGCVPQADRKLRDSGLSEVSMVGVQQIDKIVEVVEQTLQGNTVRHLGQRRALPALDLPKIRRNPLVEIIPLSTGCLGACTYCKTRYARGALGSYAPEVILERVSAVIKEGVTEVWLSSEDTGAYGRDINTSLSQLLDQIVELLPEDVMLRVGMTNPPFILSQLDSIARVLNHPNVFSFLHIPVQSASNVVLEKMFREYTIEEFCTVADYLLKNVPSMTVATDIICGFPGETDEDFDLTMALIEQYRFGIVNISQFYPRPGTPAAKMKRVPTQIAKDRSRRLTRLFESLTPYATMDGTEHKIWINTEVSDDQRFNVGHTKSYVKVLVPGGGQELMGTTALVRVVSTHRFHVVAEIISVKKIPSYSQSIVEAELYSSPASKANVRRHEKFQPVGSDLLNTENNSHTHINNQNIELASCDCEKYSSECCQKQKTEPKKENSRSTENNSSISCNSCDCKTYKTECSQNQEITPTKESAKNESTSSSKAKLQYLKIPSILKEFGWFQLTITVGIVLTFSIIRVARR